MVTCIFLKVGCSVLQKHVLSERGGIEGEERGQEKRDKLLFLILQLYDREKRPVGKTSLAHHAVDLGISCE